MGAPITELKQQAKGVWDTVESGIEVVGERSRPLIRRHGMKASVLGVAAVAALGVVLLVVWGRRRPPLGVRRQKALPDSVSTRLERPLSTMRAAAGRLRH
jgi:hypothetical protein